MFEAIPPLLSAKCLVLSGCLAIFLSSWLGAAMLIPRQTASPETPRRISWKQIGAAHIDWIMLGLMSCAAGALIMLFDVALPLGCILLMIFGAWVNPTAYAFKAFGIDAFRFSGGLLQRSASALSGLSSAAILTSWSIIFFKMVS